MGNCKDEVVAAGEYIWGRSLIHAGEEGSMGPIYNGSGFCISVQTRGSTNMSGYQQIEDSLLVVGSSRNDQAWLQ